ncbi:8910_t:CDS:1, partial [Racocetra fulgida]
QNPIPNHPKRKTPEKKIMGVSKRILQARNPIIEVDIPTQS